MKPLSTVAGRRQLDAKQWQACAIDPRAFGGYYDGGYRETCVEDGVAFVYVCGPLDHHPGWWLDSYDAIVCRVEYALADPEARAVVMCFDSPGGDASGVEEAHRKIKTMRATYGKPVYAYSNESCYSAAYWLASACDGIWLPPTGGVGSVGVIAEAYDTTAFNAQHGVRVELVTTGKQKADGHPDRPLTDEILARVQARVDQIGELFFARVAEARGLKPEAVEALQAACLLGADAKAAGLADDVISFDDFLADVRGGFDTGKKRATTTGAVMTPTEKSLSDAITAADAALAAAKTPEDRAACAAKLSAAIDAKVKYMKRTRTDELEEDDGDDDSDPDNSKPDNDKPDSEDEDADEEADEDAEDEDADEEAEDEESEEEAKANAAKSLARLAHPKRGAARVEALFRAVAKVTKRTKLDEQLGALAGLESRIAKSASADARLAKLEAARRSDRVNALLSAALKKGQITPGQVEHLRAKSPKWLKGYLASLPVNKPVRTVEDGARAPRAVEGQGPELSIATMSEDERKMYQASADSLGISLDKYLEHAKTIAPKFASARPTH